MNMLKLKSLLMQPIIQTLVIIAFLLLGYSLSQDGIYLIILALYVISFVSLSVHELGHVLAGKFVGMKLHFMSVWFILMLPSQKGFKLKFNKFLPLSFGMASMYIDELNPSEKRIRNSLSIFYLGGTIANILVLTLSTTLKMVFLNNSLFLELTNYFIIINIIIILATAIPIANYTDVSKVLNLYFSKNKDELFLTYKIQHMYHSKKPENICVKILEQYLHQVKSPESIYNLGMLLASCHCKNNNYEKCMPIIKEAIAKIEKLDDKNLIIILNFYQILFKLTSRQDLNKEDINLLSQISIIYGSTFYSLSQGVLCYIQSDYSKSNQWLSVAMANRDELLDRHQENIIKNIIDSIKVEMRT